MPLQTPTKPHSVAGSKVNLFKPEMPRIPGVNDDYVPATAGASTSAANGRKLQIVAGVFAVMLIGVALMWWIKSMPHGAATPMKSSSAAGRIPAFEPAAGSTFGAYTGPTVAATARELANPWSAKAFTFVKPVTHENIDAMVVRLPGGTLWAFALQEPYGHCSLQYISDVRELAAKYSFRAAHPMIVNPCNATIYDPMKISSDSNVWSRGQIVQGGGVRPPFAINVQMRRGVIIADRME